MSLRETNGWRFKIRFCASVQPTLITFIFMVFETKGIRIPFRSIFWVKSILYFHIFRELWTLNIILNSDFTNSHLMKNVNRNKQTERQTNIHLPGEFERHFWTFHFFFHFFSVFAFHVSLYDIDGMFHE